MVLGGMPTIEAIQAATITNAFLLGIDNEVGQIKEGFLADIIAVNENPLVKKRYSEIVFLRSFGGCAMSFLVSLLAFPLNPLCPPLNSVIEFHSQNQKKSPHSAGFLLFRYIRELGFWRAYMAQIAITRYFSN